MKINWKERERQILYGVLVLFVFIRVGFAYTTLEMQSPDYLVYLQGWYTDIQNMGGLAALREQVGNYGILYQTLIALMTYLPMSSLTKYKLLSLAFDLVLAAASAALVREILQRENRENAHVGFVAAGIMVLMLPTAILNSSVWAQCDSMYTAFAVLALLFLCREQYAVCSLMLGIAFSLKLQTILILPVFLFVMFLKRRLHDLPLALVSWWITCIPGFLAGRSLLAPIEIYMGQASEGAAMSANLPNIWVLIGMDAERFSDYAILYTFALLVLMMLYGLHETGWGERELSARRIVEYACLLTWTCVMFMPTMHERYSYAVEILLVILVILDRWYLPCLILEEAMILLRYRLVLFDGTVITDGEALLYVLAYLLFAVLMYTGRRRIAEMNLYHGQARDI